MTRKNACAKEAVQKWLDTVVIDLNLCPFAKPVLRSGALILETINGDTEKSLTAIARACEQLDSDQAIETSLLILETGFSDFDDYLDFVAMAEALLIDLGYEGIYQIASFHPHYVFEDNSPTDLDNFTNRSPYPIIHLLRESSITTALSTHADASGIPERNRQTLRAMNEHELKRRLANCFQ